MTLDSIQPAPLLAEASSLPTVLMWTGILIGAVLLASTLVLWIRRRVLAKDAPVGPGMTLHELRTLRDEGRLSEEEFESLRLALVRHASGVATTRLDETKTARPADSASESGRAGEAVDWDARARPGYDLTGRPLPGGGEDGAGSDSET